MSWFLVSMIRHTFCETNLHSACILLLPHFFVALEYYNMENIWKSSGVYKKIGSTEMPMVRIFTSRGHLSDKKQPSFAEVGFYTGPEWEKEKMKGWTTVFCPPSNVLHHPKLSFSPKEFVQQQHKHLQDLFSFWPRYFCLLSWDMMMMMSRLYNYPV